MSDIKQALGAIREVAKAFAPLATIGADIDRLEALVAHEDELKTSIEAKLAQGRELDADMARKRAECDAEIARTQATQRNAEIGYEARLDALNREYQTTRDRTRREIAEAKAAVDVAENETAREIDAITQYANAERQRIATEHNTFIEQTKNHRAAIEANTALLENRLEALREQAKGALAAVTTVKE